MRRRPGPGCPGSGCPAPAPGRPGPPCSPRTARPAGPVTSPARPAVPAQSGPVRPGCRQQPWFYPSLPCSAVGIVNHIVHPTDRRLCFGCSSGSHCDHSLRPDGRRALRQRRLPRRCGVAAHPCALGTRGVGPRGGRGAAGRGHGGGRPGRHGRPALGRGGRRGGGGRADLVLCRPRPGAGAGERPGPLVYLGGAVCLVATVLVSSEGIGRGRPATRPGGRGLLLGIAGGLAFGLFFLFLRYAGASGVLWPSAVARITGALVVTGAGAWVGGRAWRSVSPWLLAAAIVSGVLDAAANVCYVAATRDGLFGIAVVLTSLYPGITVLLARVVLRERMRLPQVAGLLLAVAGIALVTV